MILKILSSTPLEISLEQAAIRIQTIRESPANPKVSINARREYEHLLLYIRTAPLRNDQHRRRKES